MNSKKGISLIVLVITIAVLLIISSAVIYTSADASNNAKLVAFASDLQQVEDLVTEYYITNNELPILTETSYTEATLVASIEEGADELSGEITLNGDTNTTFYKIDMSKLDISSTSRGVEKDGDLTDVFVIAEDTMNIYYLKGLKVAGKYYFSLTEELSGKTKVEKTENIDTSTTTIVKATKAIILKKSETEWTRELTVNVTTDLAEEETLKYYIAGKDVTDGVTDNTINVSEILIADSTLKNTFYASENNKKVKVEKYSGETLIAEKTISVANLDMLSGSAITDENISYTKYDKYIMAKIEGYSDLGGSGLKEIRVLYTTKLDSEGKEVAYYDDLPAEITKEYVYSSGVKHSSTTFKIPSDVASYSLVFVDNARNISDVLNAATVEDELAGTWVFNDTLTFTTEFTYYLDFATVSGLECEGIRSSSYVHSNITYYMLDYLESGAYWDNKYDEVWIQEYNKTITISTKLSEMENGEEFLTWLKSNAVKQGD